jgi:hypothetical protein
MHSSRVFKWMKDDIFELIRMGGTGEKGLPGPLEYDAPRRLCWMYCRHESFDAGSWSLATKLSLYNETRHVYSSWPGHDS